MRAQLWLIALLPAEALCILATLSSLVSFELLGLLHLSLRDSPP